MQRQNGCHFSDVFDPDGADEKKVTSCIECLPGGGHCADFFQDAGDHCPESGCDASPEEYYCPLNATFDGQNTWAVCDDGCLDDDKGMLSRKTSYIQIIEEI